MGSEKGYDDEKPLHKVHLERYGIAKTPITNAQYRLFVEATGQRAPEHWNGGNIPRGLENHPVVNVAWHDVLAYCRWLSDVTGKSVTLPSEAEWEKAARGGLPPSVPPDGGEVKGQREYPWGNAWKEGYCNSSELGVEGTTPVGIFPEGASPYGCLDMVGNVWEWTRSLWGKNVGKPDFKYPYRADDGRENLETGNEVLRVLRGGAFDGYRYRARCAYRLRNVPDYGSASGGFRVVVSLSRA
jgi:formylglycine-generating enzyme required for sulfatase activity